MGLRPHASMLAWCADRFSLETHEHALSTWVEGWGFRPVHVLEDWLWDPRWADKAPSQHTTLPEDQIGKPMYSWAQGCGFTRKGGVGCVGGEKLGEYAAGKE